MQFSIASYSFHRLLKAGDQDMFKYIQDSKRLGMSYLDPWNGHLVPLKDEDLALKEAGSQETHFSSAGLEYARSVKQAADDAGLPVDCLAVDGAHIYEPNPEQRAVNRACAYRWMEIAEILGAKRIRLDTGGEHEMTEEMFNLIIEGYHDLIAYAKPHGLEVILENHWGASHIPQNILRILEAVPELKLLFDTHNFAPGLQVEGWDVCAPHAKSVHIKTFEFDAEGNEANVDLSKPISLLIKSGYTGIWGIESVPKDGDEYGAVEKTKALIERILEAL